MAVREEIEITVAPDGEVSVRVKGVKGSRCLDLTRWLEDELGTVRSRERSSEFYQEDEVASRARLEETKE